MHIQQLGCALQHQGSRISAPTSTEKHPSKLSSLCKEHGFLQVGFEAIDALAAEHGLTWGKKLTHKALTAEGHIFEKKVVLCKPMTFMNVSGESVRPLAKKHGFEIDQV